MTWAGGIEHLDVGLGELAAFVVLAEEQSFTRAAARLHLSQPGMSARIARLERAVGRRLLARTSRRVELTDHGAALLPAALAALDAVHGAFDEIDQARAGIAPVEVAQQFDNAASGRPAAGLR